MDDTTPSPLPHAGVHFPPPLVYAIAFAGGYLVHRTHPLAITAGPSTGREVAAAAFVIVYLVLFVSAIAAFRRARTTLIPNQPAAALVARGPYRFTRNPMYVSLVALYVGVALFTNSWWPLLFLPIVVLIIDRFVIAREERYLLSAFPEYAAYRAQVRRWL